MIEYDQKIVGRQIRKYRYAKKLNQKELADLVGVAPSYISDLERGGKAKNSSVSMNVICKLADVLGVSVDDLADTNSEYFSNANSNNLASEIQKELLSMTISDIILYDKLVSIFIETNKKV